MVLHTTFSGVTLASTGSGTFDTVASTGYFPTGDSEIQMRGGGLPRFIGYDNFSGEIIQIGAASADHDEFKISCNTWATADYIQQHVMKSANGAAAKYGHMSGNGQPIWMVPGIPMDQDADWEVKVSSTTASMSVLCALYLSYGTPIPAGNGQLVTRQVALASDDGVYPAYGTAGTISDLDPRFNYRVAGMQLANVEDKNGLGMFLTSPSNNTTIGAVTGTWTSTTLHPNTIPVWFPHDSIIVSGVETLTVGSFSDATGQKTTMNVFFEKIGGRGGGGRTAAQAPAGTSGRGAGAGRRIASLGSLFGR